MCAGHRLPSVGGDDDARAAGLAREVFQRQPVVALDLVEVAPSVDPTGITAANAAHVLLQVLGHIAASGEGSPLA